MSSSRDSLKKKDITGSGASLASTGGSAAGAGGGASGTESDESQHSTDPQVLSQQLREVKEERDRLASRYDQVRMAVCVYLGTWGSCF